LVKGIPQRVAQRHHLLKSRAGAFFFTRSFRTRRPMGAIKDAKLNSKARERVQGKVVGRKCVAVSVHVAFQQFVKNPRLIARPIKPLRLAQASPLRFFGPNNRWRILRRAFPGV